MTENTQEPSEISPVKDRLILFGGVILPLAAATFEAVTHFCARHFFDPFPSPNHLLMFLLIPLSNFMAWLTRKLDMSHHYFFMALSSGMAAGIGVMYTLMFLPILGLSLAFTAALGFGLLGLAPLISLPCTMRNGAMICRLASKKTYFDPHQVKHIGHLIILVMVVAIELPSTLTRAHLHMADNPDSAADGIRWLRKYGSREVMLRACYERSGRATDILGSLYESAHPLSIDHARRIFYRVTGKAFNSVAIPPAARATIQHTGAVSDIAGVNAGVDDEFDLDADIAGEVVSGVARGLSVTESTVKGSLDPDALLSKLDWSIILKNTSKYDREARAKVLLPRNSVVTDAFIVVDGVEKRATLMIRGAARVKYVNAITQKKKDPLLISTSGPDEVLLQCFPVQPQKATEVRLSIVCPMSLDENLQGVLGFPIIVEKNFQADVPVKISLKSKKSLVLAVEKTVSNSPEEGSFDLTSSAQLPALENFQALVRADRDANCTIVFCRDNFAPEKNVIQRRIGKERFAAPRKLLVIVDGSENMRPAIAEVAAGLHDLAVQSEILLVSDDSSVVFKGDPGVNKIEFEAAINRLEKAELIGGQDDSVALLAAAEQAAREVETAVLWIHGCQPVSEASNWNLKEAFMQKRPILYDFLVAAGPNSILNGINTNDAFIRVPRTDTVSNDLKSLFQSWQPAPLDGENQAQSEFEKLAVDDASVLPIGYETESTLAQLYAGRLIARELNANNIEPLGKVAADYHVVSPVSSAVVTEDQSIEVKKVNTALAPEADTWLLLLVAIALVMALMIMQKRKQEAAA